MADFAHKFLDNWVLTVNGNLEQHQELIRATLAKRAYELFELRGRERALHLDLNPRISQDIFLHRSQTSC
jgi:hypothetical protein